MDTSEPEPSRPPAPGLQVELGGKSRRHLAMRWLVLLVVSVAVFAITAAWLYAQSGRGTGTFGPTSANPAYIVVNTAARSQYRRKYGGVCRVTSPALSGRNVWHR